MCGQLHAWWCIGMCIAGEPSQPAPAYICENTRLVLSEGVPLAKILQARLCCGGRSSRHSLCIRDSHALSGQFPASHSRHVHDQTQILIDLSPDHHEVCSRSRWRSPE